MRLPIFIIFLLSASSLFAQTGIGTTTPNPSAKLDVYSDNKGFLPPRVTLTSASSASPITSPAEGLLVYNLGSTGLQAGYYYWNGANWATIATATSAGNGVTAMDMKLLYSDKWTNATNTPENTSGYSFTVPVSGRYLFNFSSSGYLNQAYMTFTFKVRQGTIDLASDAFTTANNNVHDVFTGLVEVNLQAGVTYNVYVTSNGTRNDGDWNRIFYKLVAGNLPVTGQTVDYVSVSRNSSQSLNTGDNVKFNVVNAGNITYDASTGNFTLSANKTYRLTGNVTLSNGNASAAEADIVWRTASGVNLGNSGMILSMNHTTTAGGNGISDIIYTPTSNTTVSLYVIWSSGNVATQSNNVFATIEQIGSSAIVNPWTLSGNDTYNNLGKVGIGNTAPTTALDVTGDTKVSGVLTAGGNTYPTNTGTNGYALTTNAAGAASWNAVPPVGVITAFAGSSAPTGYLICNGAAVSRTTYAALYAIIGTTYGTGDGSTTFNIPDLTGRVPVGKNAGTFSTLGAKAGEETHTMTVNEMPAHNHTTKVNSAQEGYNAGGIGGYAASTQTMFFGTDRAGTTTNWGSAMQNTGGGAAFNVLQPYTVINYIIKF